jgi:TRAP-type C4-dicarboxylate transport system permease small subunit
MTALRETGATIADGSGGPAPRFGESDVGERDRESVRHAARSARALKEGPVERVCNLICMTALIVMLGVIGLDIATRALLNFSFEISDELGGYMLVVISFVSLPVCQVRGSFHHVEFVQSRLSPRGRAVSHVIFDLLSLAFCAALLWQLGRFEISSWRFDDHAPTYLATPLWIPRIAMVAGAAALVFSVARSLAADIARLRFSPPPQAGEGKGSHEP